jgi:hypothetical protein
MLGIAAALLMSTSLAWATGRGSAHNDTHSAMHSTSVVRTTRVESRKPQTRRSPSGPLSYSAYWKAATSPNPPRTNQDYNRYWQKMQAWQEYQNRMRK